MAWKIIRSEMLLADYYVSVKKDCVELPEGAVIDDFYTVTIPDVEMVAAITTDGKILLKSEFRYAHGSEVIECPAGMFEENESDPLVGANGNCCRRRGIQAMTGRTSDLRWNLHPN